MPVSETPLLPSGSLPPSLALEVEGICTLFETAWQAGKRPEVEQYLNQIGKEARPFLLRELLLLDLAYRRRAGEQPVPADYQGRFPDEATLVAEVFRQTAEISGNQDQLTVTPAPEPAEENLTQPPADAAPGSPPAPLPQLPGYKLLEVLGRGGMGVVYKAWQIRAQRFVAVKMIRDGALAGPEHRARFLTEIKAAARFEHPNVVRIYEVGEHHGLPFLVMEFAEGGSFDKRLAGQPLTPRQAAEFVRTLAEAVQYTHDKQVVHRDLKPANVILTADGRPLITDFGLAKRLDSDTQLSGSKAVLGTPAYMAPEQARGDTRAVGPVVDVYALGAILYECLTGKPPFQGATSHEVLHKVMHEQPAPPTQLRPVISADLEAVCLHCLEKEPALRYQSAQALTDDLQRWLRSEPVSVSPVNELELHARWARGAGFEIEEVLTLSPRDAVYRARDNLYRVVALKVVNAPAEADQAARERLQHEAKTLALFDHPNIVRIHHSGELLGRAYHAFEFVAGGNLIERYVDRPQPPREAADLVRQLAQAMHYAHERGVLHCALKPSNILLTPEGTPKITNFGLTQQLPGPESQVRLAIRRLPSYMAPELAEGRTADVGRHTDVYALGAILYKLLTGGPPFFAQTLAATLELVRTQQAPPPSAVQAGVPPALDAICVKCLAKEPTGRYATARALAEALAAHLADKAEAPPPPTGVPTAAKGRRIGAWPRFVAWLRGHDAG
jgi:serine/threonine protein kinase